MTNSHHRTSIKRQAAQVVSDVLADACDIPISIFSSNNIDRIREDYIITRSTIENVDAIYDINLENKTIFPESQILLFPLQFDEFALRILERPRLLVRAISYPAAYEFLSTVSNCCRYAHASRLTYSFAEIHNNKLLHLYINISALMWALEKYNCNETLLFNKLFLKCKHIKPCKHMLFGPIIFDQVTVDWLRTWLEVNLDSRTDSHSASSGNRRHLLWSDFDRKCALALIAYQHVIRAADSDGSDLFLRCVNTLKRLTEFSYFIQRMDIFEPHTRSALQGLSTECAASSGNNLSFLWDGMRIHIKEIDSATEGCLVGLGNDFDGHVLQMKFHELLARRVYNSELHLSSALKQFILYSRDTLRSMYNVNHSDSVAPQSPVITEQICQLICVMLRRITQSTAAIITEYKYTEHKLAVVGLSSSDPTLVVGDIAKEVNKRLIQSRDLYAYQAFDTGTKTALHLTGHRAATSINDKFISSVIATRIEILGRPWGVIELTSYLSGAYDRTYEIFLKDICAQLGEVFHHVLINSIPMRLDRGLRGGDLASTFATIFLCDGAAIWRKNVDRPSVLDFRASWGRPDLDRLPTEALSLDLNARDSRVSILQKSGKVWSTGEIGVDPEYSDNWLNRPLTNGLLNQGYRYIAQIIFYNDSNDLDMWGALSLYDRRTGFDQRWHVIIQLVGYYIRNFRNRNDIEVESDQLKNALAHMMRDAQRPLESLAAKIEDLLSDNSLSIWSAEIRAKVKHETGMNHWTTDILIALNTMRSVVDIVILRSGYGEKVRREALRNERYTNLLSLVNACFETMRLSLVNKKIRYSASHSLSGILIRMHQGHALILFSNLASNLLKYGLPGEASVTFDRQNNCLTFQNFGAQTGLENTIFEYRTRGDNRGNEPGSGLGLNIVKYICGAYGITVEHVESGSGAIVLHNFAFYMPPEMINRGN